MRPSSHHRHGTHGAYSKIEERERKGGGGGGSCSLRLIRHAKIPGVEKGGHGLFVVVVVVEDTHTKNTGREKEEEEEEKASLFTRSTGATVTTSCHGAGASKSLNK